MAHYAKLGANNKVIAVHVVADKDCQNADGVEDEEVGRQFLERIHSWPLWKKTSYNTSNNGQHLLVVTPLRGNYAGIGMTYDEDNDIFIYQKPYASWVLNTAWKQDGNHQLVMLQSYLKKNKILIDMSGMNLRRCLG